MIQITTITTAITEVVIHVLVVPNHVLIVVEEVVLQDVITHVIAIVLLVVTAHAKVEANMINHVGFVIMVVLDLV